ncbi:MAG TPA: glycosyltransferase family 1 protein [Actinomycetota bacterium]
MTAQPPWPQGRWLQLPPEPPRPPRVGVVAEQLFGPVPGGVGRYVQALVRHLPAVAAAAEGGGAVRWITARHSSAELAEAGLPAERPAGVEAEATDGLTVPLSLPGRVLTRTWVEARQPRLPLWLLRQLDLVHATSAAVPPARGKPLVATVHDVAFRRFPDAYPASGRHFHERAARIVADEAARVLVPSAATARDLTEFYGVEAERITVTPLGAEPPPAPDPGKARGLLDRLGVRGPFLLAVGTLEPRKNLLRLVAAFAEAAAELPEHHLVVAGPAGWGASLRPEAVPPRVALAGPVDEATLHGLYDAADLLAYPSTYEGFGLPVVEAMLHGTPVLTSDRSSLPEVAGDAALLVDPTDEHAIAKGLVELTADRALRDRLIAAGRARAARFTWEATAAATWAAYQEVLRAHG